MAAKKTGAKKSAAKSGTTASAKKAAKKSAARSAAPIPEGYVEVNVASGPNVDGLRAQAELTQRRAPEQSAASLVSDAAARQAAKPAAVPASAVPATHDTAPGDPGKE